MADPRILGPSRAKFFAGIHEESSESDEIALEATSLLPSAARHPRSLQRGDHAKKRLVTAAAYLAAAGVVAAVCAFAPERRRGVGPASGPALGRGGGFTAPQRAWGNLLLIPVESRRAEQSFSPIVSLASSAPTATGTQHLTAARREAAADAAEKLRVSLRSDDHEAAVRALLQEVEGMISPEPRPLSSRTADHASPAHVRGLADDQAACTDTAGKATDDDGDDCVWYNSFGGHHEDCGLHDDADFSATLMCCECGGGLQGSYEQLTSGSCAHPITSIGECSHAAAVLQLEDVVARDDGRYPGTSTDPPYCYYEHGVLKFNSGENHGDCSELDTCICGPGGAAPPLSDAPAPPGPSGSDEDDQAVHAASEDDEVGDCTATDGLNILSDFYPCKCGPTAICQVHQVCDLEASHCKHEECPDLDGTETMPLAEFECRCGNTICDYESVCDESIDTCYEAIEVIEEEEDEKHGVHHMHDQEHDLGHENHGHSMPLLFFVLVTLGMGCVLQVLQERLMPWLPYTCMLFVMGLVLSAIHHFRPDREDLQFGPTWFHSIEMWEKSNPHALFFTFLPPLIFADAMKMNGKLIQKVFAQVVTLACPGVLIGTFLTAGFVKYVFCMYEWPNHLCILFGCITAATDPVAVVALFNTLGVSPRLTMLVSGESLLNDGTAIVLFQITVKILTGEAELTPLFAAQFVVEVVFLAVLFGALVALSFQILIFNTAESKYHTDAMIQVTVTICVAWLCFWYAEHELKASGVLAVVFAGGVFSIYSWPRFASKEAMHLVWEAIEFLGNTMIFTLGGLLFGAGVLDHSEDFEHIIQDLGLLCLLYLGSTLIRFIMIVVLLPFLNCVGPRITWGEVVVMTWSGLRGAVAIVLAIMVDLTPSINSANRARFMFHIGGMAMLTTLINAPLAKPLLEFLDMTSTPDDENRANMEMEEQANKDIVEFYEELQRKNGTEETRDERFSGHDEARIKEMVPFLDPLQKGAGSEPGVLSATPTLKASDEEAAEHRVRACREIFMRMMQHIYWANMEEGVIPKSSKVTRQLIYSTQDALEDTHLPLHDWTDVLQDTVTGTSPWPMMSKVVSMPPLNLMLPLKEMFPSEDRVQDWKVRTALCYLQAHKQCRQRIRECFGDHDTSFFADAQKQVFAESEEQCRQAKETMGEVDVQIRKLIKSKMLAGRLIHHHLHKISEMEEEGLLGSKGASAITHHLHHRYRTVAAGSHLLDVPAGPIRPEAHALQRQGSAVIQPLSVR